MSDREKLVELLEATTYEALGGNLVVKGFATAKEFADHLIANGVTVQGWFSVEDRLPDVDQEVLVCAGYGLYDVAQYSGGRTFYAFERNPARWEIISDVTHWMPLPEPLKKEGSE